MPMNNNKCVCCNSEISPERLEALPGTEYCVRCAAKFSTPSFRKTDSYFGSLDDLKETEPDCFVYTERDVVPETVLEAEG